MASKVSVVVELGSGFGDLERNLNNHRRCIYINLDWSIGLLQTARSLGRSDDRLFYVCGDAEHCPLLQESADLILISNLTPYIPNPSTLAYEARRLARRDRSIVGLLYPVKNPFWEDQFGGFAPHYFSSSEIIDAFKSVGFAVLYIGALFFQLIPRMRIFSQHLADYIEFSSAGITNTGMELTCE